MAEETAEFHERGDLDRSRIADLRQIIAGQVHEHDSAKLPSGPRSSVARRWSSSRIAARASGRRSDAIQTRRRSSLDEGLRRQASNLSDPPTSQAGPGSTCRAD